MPNKAFSTGAADDQQLDRRALATTLKRTLGLRLPPVALSFVAERPNDVREFTDGVPSACTFWRRAEEGVFFASAEAHFNCPIGAMTMGFNMSDELKQTLMGLVGQIGTMGYIDPAEAANIPSVPGDKSGIVYGPLESFPVTPDVVLLWASGNAAMLLAEATQSGNWTAGHRGTATFGRPSCAAIPVAVLNETPTFSLGCMGMRTFTAVEPELQLAVLPRATLFTLQERLDKIAAVNAQMAVYYAEQNAKFPAQGSTV
jgi:uncharacterized protein (DUF169 family)